MNTKMPKPMLIVTIAITVITLVGVGILLFISAREPSVEIVDNELRISGMYGTNVPLDDITAVVLVEDSMANIGAGRRTNGSNFRMWRGHFDAGLLFVQPNVSPTLRIERGTNPPIFVSFNDAAQTRQLYFDIAAHVGHG